MRILVKSISAIFTLSFLISLAACSPEIGSEAWCSDMKGKPKADWTANEASDYASNCVFK